jgi:hypothetical protein
VKFQGGDDSVLRPDDRSKYTLAFGADAQHRPPVGVRTIKIKSHDGVDRLAVTRMVLAYGKYQSPIGMDSNVAESEGTLRRDRLGCSSASNSASNVSKRIGKYMWL